MSARRQNFGKDTGLQARMLLTLFLLGLLYAVFVGVLFAAGAGAGLIVVVAVVLLLVQLFGSDKLAMASLGLKEVSPEEEPELHGIIDRLCVQADLPKPRVCVMETSMPNACAMGLSCSHSAWNWSASIFFRSGRRRRCRPCARRAASSTCSLPPSWKG